MTKDIELGPFEMVGAKGKQTKKYLEPRFTVTIGTLSAEDSMTADDYIGASQNGAKAQKIYALASIKRIQGKQVHPLQDADQFARVMRHFDGPQGLSRLLTLTQEFFKFADEAAKSNDPKDSPEDQPSSE